MCSLIHVLRILLFCCVLVGSALGHTSSALENVQRARTLLGPDVWSRIVRVENVARSTTYPRTVYALIFETSGILWFYTDVNGTQSLSLHRHNLAAEKANLMPLLQKIEPGFVRFEIVASGAARLKESASIPNGCMIESLAAARKLIDEGVEVKRATLLSFYFNVNRTIHGHTLLGYESDEGAFLLDPADPARRIYVGDHLPDEPMVLASKLDRPGVSIFKARTLSIPLPRSTAAMLADSGESSRPTSPAMIN